MILFALLGLLLGKLFSKLIFMDHLPSLENSEHFLIIFVISMPLMLSNAYVGSVWVLNLSKYLSYIESVSFSLFGSTLPANPGLSSMNLNDNTFVKSFLLSSSNLKSKKFFSSYSALIMMLSFLPLIA